MFAGSSATNASAREHGTDPLTRIRQSATAIALLAVAALCAAAQVPDGSSPDFASFSALEGSEDPLGRGSPRGTMVAFLRAVEREDFVAAGRYLQLRESQRASAEALARDLKALMDRYFARAVGSISDSPDGALDDALPLDRERIGPLALGERNIEILLVRVPDPHAGRIWLISSETLAQIPALRSAIAGSSWIERTMPDWLLARTLFGISLGHWVALAAALVVPFCIFVLVFGLLAFVLRRIVRDAAREREVDAWYAGLRWPAVAVLTLVAHAVAIPRLALPLTFRIVYGRAVLVLVVVALAWLLRRISTLGFARARSLVWGKDRASTQSLLLLGERLLKAVVVLIAVFLILTIVGVDTATALAGLGIGGVALALGAQKTVENFLGGVFLLTDRAIAVGDFCSIADRLGVVEDITLRSVRLRTLDQTIVSVPAGVLAQAGIENFTTRGKILMQTVLRLRHGTRVEHIKTILDRIRALLHSNSRIESPGARVRLIAFGAEAIELELFAYILTAEIADFLAVREGLLLEIAAIVEAEGSAFAQPTQFVYMADEAGKPPAALAATGTEAGSAYQSSRATTFGRSGSPS